MSDKTDDVDVPTPPLPERSEFARFPVWWWLIVGSGLFVSVVVAGVDQAFSYTIGALTILIGILILLVRYLRRGEGRLAFRALPLLAFLGLLGVAAAIFRIDDVTGNLVPTKVSLRWKPQRDQLLHTPEVSPTADGVDLLTTSEADFPQFLGPERNGAIEFPSLEPSWQIHRPKLVWRIKEFGAGWSAFAAVNGYAITQEQRGDQELTTCYEVATGDLQWSNGIKARHQTVPGGVGPRSTPTIAQGKVYTMGAGGMLRCLHGETGDELWRQDLLDIIGITHEEDMSLIAWGRSASPLVDKGRVIVPLGGADGPSLGAFDADSGKLLWKHGPHQISYASPMITMLGGIRQIVLVCQNFVSGFDAETGEHLWDYDWPGMSNANASVSQPIAVGNDQLFFSKGYAHGAALVKIKSESSAWSVEEIWHKRTVMKTKFTNAIVYQDHVYGLDDSILSCVELATGKKKWKGGRFGHGQILRVGEVLLVQAESGRVHLVTFNDKGFEDRGYIAALSGKTWNNLVVHGEYLLVRNAEQAACYRLPIQPPMQP